MLLKKKLQQKKGFTIPTIWGVFSKISDRKMLKIVISAKYFTRRKLDNSINKLKNRIFQIICKYIAINNSDFLEIDTGNMKDRK